MSTTASGTSASAVSAFLRRAGWRPIQTLRREGVRVGGPVRATEVRVTADWDDPMKALAEADEMVQALTAEGFNVRRNDAGTILYVSRRPS